MRKAPPLRGMVSAWLAQVPGSDRRVPTGREAAIAWAELAGLCAIALAQPIFDRLGTPGVGTVFAALGVRGTEVVLFTVAMLALPPTVLLLVELAVGAAWPPGRRLAHALLLAALAAALAWQAAFSTGIAEGGLARLLFLGGFAVALLLYLRTEWTRALVRVLAAAPLVVGILFLVQPPASQLFGAERVESPRLGSSAPVIFLLLDELPLASLIGPDGEIDERLFPNFASLASQSTWYPNARTVADQSSAADPAILTGSWPHGNAAPTQAEYPRNMFTLFGGSYRTNVYQFATDLCPRDLCPDRLSLASKLVQLATGGSSVARTLPFDLTDKILEEALEQVTVGPPPLEVIGEFGVAIAESADEPTLSFHHHLLPHQPWILVPSGKAYRAPVLGGWGGSEELAEQGFQRHLLQAQFVDRELGVFLAGLRRIGLLDRSLLVITADHGIAFAPDLPQRLLEPANAGWILPVPLFIKAPGQDAGEVSRRPIRSVDILPTIAELLDVRIPWHVDGTPFGPPSAPAVGRYFAFESGELEIPESELVELRQETIRERNRLVGAGSVYAFGGHAGLIGKQAAALGQDAEALGITLEEPEALANVDTAGAELPLFVTGDVLDFDHPPGAPVALVLNGRVAATARVYAAHFSTMLPDAMLRDGANSLEVYDLSGFSRRSGRGSRPRVP